MLTSQELTDMLRGHGYKVTPQRLAVYEALADEVWHPNAEMLYRKLQPKFPAMSFATVYKSIEILQAINVIRVLNIGEDSYRYDANITEHCHLHCLQCGRVEDAMPDGAATDNLTQLVEASSGYAINTRQFFFYGLCPECRKVH